jgi:GTP pyrophosphokinase
MLDREIKKLGLKNVELDQIAKNYDFKNVEDLHVAIGCGELPVGRIINNLVATEASTDDPLLITKPASDKPISGDSVTVLGLKGLLTVLARCCKPAPGDDIVGYITRGRGATIHRADCPNILRMEDRERIVKVSWGELHKTYPVAIQVKAYDRQGLMGDISTVLSNEGGNLVDIELKVTHNLATIKLMVEVSDISQLSRLLTRIENLPNVMEAYRLRTI